MSDIIISERQLHLIKKNVSENDDKEILDEAWYNTAMEVIGLVDPTPITDTINAASYFYQGNTLFGVLSLVSALPFYVGDFVAKPVMNAMKIGSKSTKELERALKLAKTDTKAAKEILEKLSQEKGPVGAFLQKAGGPNGWAEKVNKFINEIPAGPFKGMKKTIMDYFTLLGSASQKSMKLQSNIKALLNAPTAKNMQTSIPMLKNLLKNTKVVDVAALSKPGMFRQVFFGGLPRIFRSPEGRRIRILMQQTKWWLGFLDYIGFGNWVGEEEVIKKLGSESEYQKAIERYQQTPEAKKYLDQSLVGLEEPRVSEPQQQSSQGETQGEDSIAKMLRGMLLGRLNPLPGM